MARINSKRVSQVVDYERDIKGKKLIRLSAGVGSGKNYWIGQISRDYPDLRILLITSRINIVNAQARKLNAQTFIDIDKLVTRDEDWDDWGDEKFRRVACTNARIEAFVKYQYSAENSNTHIWNKFDLIVVDEVHSLTVDATFTDSPFHVEKFIKKAYNSNPDCDILFMSGTQEPIDWMFTGSISERITNVDLFDECIHLEPDRVILYSKTRVVPQLKKFLDDGERIVYFANYIGNIANIVTKLVNLGVEPDVFGFSFNCGKNDAKKFPECMRKGLSKHIKIMNDQLTKFEKLPDNVQIFFTTSKNKEGITISDDIKIMFVESNNKNDIKQMAGRVRGNPDTGRGIKDLAIVYDSHKHDIDISRFEFSLQEKCIETSNSALKEYYKESKETGREFDLSGAIKTTESIFKYIRYDYFRKKFVRYSGRIYGDIQDYNFSSDLHNIVAFYNEEDTGVFSENRTGKEYLEQEWFPYSKAALYPQVSTSDIAKQKLEEYLITNQFIGVVFNRQNHDEIHKYISEITHLYDCRDIGIKKPYAGNFQLKPALEKFGYELVPRQHGLTYIIKHIEEDYADEM